MENISVEYDGHVEKRLYPALWNDTEFGLQSFHDVIDAFKASLFHHHEPLTIALIIVYVIVFLLAFLGNGIVLLIVYQHKDMRSVTNCFLVNLAAADLLVTLITIPFTVAEMIYSAWVYGVFMCKATGYFQGVSIAASVLTITCLSMDRYIAIKHPVKSRVMSTSRNVVLALVVTWVLSCLLMVPLLMVRTLKPYDVLAQTLLMCHEQWNLHSNRQIYDVTLFVVIYVIPGFIVIIAYLTTGCSLLSQNKVLNRNNSEITNNKKVMSSRRKVARMLVTVAILFALSWLPYYITLLCMDFSDGTQDLTVRVLQFALLLGHSHSAQNPIIYFCMNSNFNRGFKRVFGCKVAEPHTMSRSPTQRHARNRSDRSFAYGRENPEQHLLIKTKCSVSSELQSAEEMEHNAQKRETPPKVKVASHTETETTVEQLPLNGMHSNCNAAADRPRYYHSSVQYDRMIGSGGSDSVFLDHGQLNQPPPLKVVHKDTIIILAKAL